MHDRAGTLRHATWPLTSSRVLVVQPFDPQALEDALRGLPVPVVEVLSSEVQRIDQDHADEVGTTPHTAANQGHIDRPPRLQTT